MTTVAICAITFHRPRGLDRLLHGIAALEVPDDVDLRVVIVDNDPEASATTTLDAHAATFPWSLVTGVQPERGIPAARNLSVQLAGDVDFVAFIDDDEVPSPGWLGALLDAQRRSGAAAVMGPVEPAFEEEPPRWVVEGDFFARDHHVDGEEMAFGTTSNALVARAVLSDDGAPFDVRMTLTGGSDSHLFQRVRLAGHRIVWAEAAAVTELNPPSRVSVRWLCLRQYRRGITRSTNLRLLEDSRRRRAKRFAYGASEVVVGLAVAVTAVRGGKVALVRGLRRTGYGAGMVAGLFGVQYQEYATVHGR